MAHFNKASCIIRSLEQRRGFCQSILLLQKRKNTWVLPEIKTTINDKDNKSAMNHTSRKGGTNKRTNFFASLNGGSVVNENWRSVKTIPEWKRQKLALKEKFGEAGWNPRKKLSRDTIDQIKVLNQQYPEFNSKVIADAFRVSPEAVRRILKSNFKPSAVESEKIMERWKKRGQRHLANKYIDQITERFVQEKQELQQQAQRNGSDGDDTSILQVEDPKKLKSIVIKNLLGKDDILKP